MILSNRLALHSEAIADGDHHGLHDGLRTRTLVLGANEYSSAGRATDVSFRVSHDGGPGQPIRAGRMPVGLERVPVNFPVHFSHERSPVLIGRSMVRGSGGACKQLVCIA